MSEPRSTASGPARRSVRLLILLAGIIFGQAVLYGPSLIGSKILLPLDILTPINVYLPRTPEIASIVPRDSYTMDLVFHSEPCRRFAASEIKAGRLPMWNPYQFAGAPFVWPKFSPFYFLESLTESPIIIPWSEMLAAIVSGLGAYLFFRRALALSFWPSCLAAWCYPLTGFFILWQGYPTSPPARWLPWILLAVRQTIDWASNDAKGRWAAAAPVGLSAATALVLISGHLDIAAQVLLASGLYALWEMGARALFGGSSVTAPETPKPKRSLALVFLVRSSCILVVAWALGFLLASPYLLPFLEYTQTSARMDRRIAGEEDHPPMGINALPQLVLPDMYGRTERGSFRLPTDDATGIIDNTPESTASAFAGLIAGLVAAPLAFASRRHLRDNLGFVALAFLSLAWALRVPGLVSFLRLHGINMLPHNRFVFVAAFCLLALAAVGLQTILVGSVKRRWRLGLAVIPAAALCGWCFYRSLVLPTVLETSSQLGLQQGGETTSIVSAGAILEIQSWFSHYYVISAVWCAVALLLWAMLLSARVPGLRRVWIVGALMLVDMLWFGIGRNSQSDPRLYYPPVPVLTRLAAQDPAGRMIGKGCLPANLATVCRLRDVRGYDAVDPARIIELLGTTTDILPSAAPYAMTQWLDPTATPAPGGDVRFAPAYSLLGVRYLVNRGTPPSDVRSILVSQDYWVQTNITAMPRAYIPRQAQYIPDKTARLTLLGAPNFDPRQTACVETPVELPTDCQGTAQIVSEIPTRVVVAADMASPGLLVLADLWDKGWRARLNGGSVNILRANHAVRGVLLPAGKSTVEFRYVPASFTWGVQLCALALVILLARLIFVLKRPAAAAVS